MKKNLVRKLKSLATLLEEFEASSDKQYKKDAFADAISMCSDILLKVDSDRYDEAIQVWGRFERFANDSIPLNENFLSSYLPLRQSIINFGMQM